MYVQNRSIQRVKTKNKKHKNYTYCDVGDFVICERTRKGKFKEKVPPIE